MNEAKEALKALPASPQIQKKRKGGTTSSKKSFGATPSKDPAGSKHRLLELDAARESKGTKLIEWFCADCLQCKNSLVHKAWAENRRVHSHCSSYSNNNQSSSSSNRNIDDGIRSQSSVDSHQRDVSAAVAAAVSHDLLHRRVLVWWKDDRCCYGGVVEAYDPYSRRHLVLYDDGEWEFIDLACEPVLFVVQ